MRNAGLEEAQAGIKIARRNINNLRCADDTTLMAESEEELKSILIKVKEESEKVGLKLSIQKMKIMASGPITSWEIVRHSARGKGHEEGGSTYTKAGSSLRSPPGCSRASPPPKKTGGCLLYCFVLSPLISLGAVPHHHLALSVKELTYSSNS